jgi:threonine/homoserine/homoserine lactone efflux protein
MSADGLAWLASAAGFALAMSFSPGPNNAMLAASGANFGLRRTVPHLLGVALGFPVMLLLVALGAAELLHAAPGLQEALRWAGAAWLLWLAWRIANAAPATAAAAGMPPPPPPPPGQAARPMSFLSAALFQWVNPKAWMIAAGGVAAYTGGDVLAEAAALALVFGLATLPTCAGWAAMGAGLGRLLARPAALRRFNQAMGALLALSVAPMLAG